MPNRIIRESAKTSASLAALSDLAERTFWRIIMTLDDYGRYHGNELALLAACYPVPPRGLTAERFAAAIAELEAGDLVRFYQHGDRLYIYSPTWRKYQRLRAKDSQYPEPLSSLGRGHRAVISPPSAAGVGVGVGVGVGGGSSTAAIPDPCAAPGCTKAAPPAPQIHAVQSQTPEPLPAAVASLPPPAYVPKGPVAECQDCIDLLRMLADGGVYFASPGPVVLARVHAAHDCGMDLAKAAVRSQLDKLRGGDRRFLAPKILFDPPNWEVTVNAVKGAPRLVHPRV